MSNSTTGMQIESAGNFMQDHISQNQYINEETEGHVQNLENIINRFKKADPKPEQTSENLVEATKAHDIPDGVDCLNASNQTRRDLNKKLSYLLEKLQSLI